MDIKIITKLGWSMITEEIRDDLKSRVIRGNEIDAAALAFLINECRDTCYALTNHEVERVTEQQLLQKVTKNLPDYRKHRRRHLLQR